jgi:hypothetical protein
VLDKPDHAPEPTAEERMWLQFGLTRRHRTTASLLDTWQDADLPIRTSTHWPDTLH